MCWCAAIVTTTREPSRTGIASAVESVRSATDRPLIVALHGPLMPAEADAGSALAIATAARTPTPLVPARIALPDDSTRRIREVVGDRFSAAGERYRCAVTAWSPRARPTSATSTTATIT